MDRQIVYVGAIPQDTDLLLQNKNAMIGLGMALQAVLGTATAFDGLACTPTGPAGMTVNVAPGSVYSLQNVDSTVYGSLAADTTHQIVKQGIVLGTTNLPCPAPGTTGQSIVYLIQAAYQDLDGGSVVLPYYNASNPSQAYNGPNNSGVSQNTVRQGICQLQVKAGVAATTGTQTTPAPDVGFIGLYAITVANGQSTITSGNIVQLSTAPFISPKLPSVISTVQSGASNYAVDTSGTPNTITVSLSPVPASIPAGFPIHIKIANTTTGAPVINLNGNGNVAVYDTNGAALGSGALKQNSVYKFVFDGAHWELQSIPANISYSGGGYAADTGSANTYAATIPSITSLTAGTRVSVLLAHTNTGTSTFALNAFGAIAIKKLSADETSLVNVVANDLPNGFIVDLEHDGTFWQALNIRGLLGAVASKNIGAGLYDDGSGNLAARSTRETLTATRTYYVRTDGSDSNTGLANTSGGAFLTIQKAVNTVLDLDLGGQTVNIQVGDGTYTGGVAVGTAFTGRGTVNLIGNTTTPANCIISTTSNHCMLGTNKAVFNVGGFKLTAATSGNLLLALDGAIIYVTGAMEFGSVSSGSTHISVTGCAEIIISANYKITGGGRTHWTADCNGVIRSNGLTVTITGTPAFVTAFAEALHNGTITPPTITFSGSATGPRYLANANAVIDTSGGGATYLPGSTSGSTATGGQYL